MLILLGCLLVFGMAHAWKLTLTEAVVCTIGDVLENRRS